MKKCILIVLCFINICIILCFCGCNGNYDINELYAVTDNEDFTYDYVIKDKNNNILISDKGVSREPKINIINENLLSVSVQTGTGISTQWTVYCDVNSGKVSDTYYSVLGEYAENVVFVNYENGKHSIVIQDVFSQEQYFKKVMLEDASKVTDTVVNYEKLDDKVKLLYLKGDNFLETELIIEIKSIDLLKSYASR